MKTVKLAGGAVTWQLVEGEGNASPEQLAEMLSAIAVGVRIQMEPHPDRGPEVWEIVATTTDPTAVTVTT